ncbi:MAG: HEAT repeat domain-containing protein [Planctomycetes bacterium]|nr:HEAT repeat domain-containing protein [Planctomycetota bacterium]
MVKLRIAVLSVAILIACVSGAFWAVFAAERLAPETGAFSGFARRATPPPAPVVSGSGLASTLPAASDVRSVQALLARMRQSFDGPTADWRETCSMAADAVRFGPAAVDPLARIAGDDRELRGLRLLAIDMLARIEDAAAVPALIGCLDKRHPEDVRAAAVTALGANAVGRERASWLFFDLVRSDAHPAVRARAADLVGRSGDPRAVSLLENVIRDDASPTVRLAAAGGLGAILEPGSLETLRDVGRMDRDATVRTAAVEAAGNYREPRLREFFQSIEAGDDTQQVRAAARRQLWRIPAED